MLKISQTVFRLLLGFTISVPMWVVASELDTAIADDISKLCDDKSANELFKIANKNNNSDELRRDALANMIEVSRECFHVSDSRLRQYHQKMINASHKVLSMSEVESRQVAVEAFQYVILLPDAVKPTEGAISRGQTLSDIARNDSDVYIRLWALEALVTLKGGGSIVQTTLEYALLDSQDVVREMAQEMLFDLFGL